MTIAFFAVEFVSAAAAFVTALGGTYKIARTIRPDASRIVTDAAAEAVKLQASVYAALEKSNERMEKELGRCHNEIDTLRDMVDRIRAERDALRKRVEELLSHIGERKTDRGGS
jgi:chromosome segregation ATPase